MAKKQVKKSNPKGAKRVKDDGKWFKKLRGSYIPSSWQGWLTYIPYVTFLVITFMAVNRQEHSASDVFFGIFPYWICAAIVMQWLAGRKS